MWQSPALGNITLGAFVLCEAYTKQCCWPWHLSMLLLAPVCLFGCALYFGSVWLRGSRSLQREFILLSTAVSHLRSSPKQTPPELGSCRVAAVAGRQLWWCPVYVTSHIHLLSSTMWCPTGAAASATYFACVFIWKSILKYFTSDCYWVKRIILACFTVPLHLRRDIGRVITPFSLTFCSRLTLPLKNLTSEGAAM